MKYADGQELRLGDQVRVGTTEVGVVIASLDTGQFTDRQAKIQWRYLKQGALVMAPTSGLIHCKNLGKDIKLVQRAPENRRSQ
jgi:hypothetical protein